MGLYDTDKAEVTRKAQNKVSPDYDDTDIESLQKRYTPEQLKAITLGESVIPAKDLVLQGRMRNDPYRMQYVDDFATIQETVDKRVKTGKPVDTSARFLSQDEFEDDFLDWTSGGKRRDDVDAGEAYKLFEEMRSKMLSKADGGELTVADLEDAMDRVPVGHGIRREPGTARLEFGVPHEELEAMTPQERQKKFEEFLAKIPDESLEEMVEEDEKRKLRAKLSKKGLEGVALEAAVEKELEQPTDDGGLFTHKYIMEHNAMTGFNGGDTALAPGLPDKVPGVAGLYKKEMDDEEAKLDPEGKFQELKRQTGLSIREIIALFNRNSKVLVRRYVSNQTRLGKIRSSYVLAIAGNEDGWLGLGEAKSTDSETATNKAKLAAIRNMQPIRRYENRTIYGHVEAKIGGTIVQLYSRPPGTFQKIPEIPMSYSSSSTRWLLINKHCRIRPPPLPPLLRDSPSRRPPGSRGQDASFSQPHELGQGVRPSPDEPAGPRADRHGQGQEARGRQEGVLWWCRILDSESVPISVSCARSSRFHVARRRSRGFRECMLRRASVLRSLSPSHTARSGYSHGPCESVSRVGVTQRNIVSATPQGARFVRYVVVVDFASWGSAPSLPRLVAPVELLLQHNTVNAGLEQGEDEARLALELAQAVEDLGGRLGRHGVEDRGQLCSMTVVHGSVRKKEEKGIHSPTTEHTRTTGRARSGGRGGRCRLTFFMLSARRTYSSMTSCSRGESSSPGASSALELGWSAISFCGS